MIVAIALLWPGHRGRAQSLTRPEIAWKTVETRHFTFHFPAAMSEWTLSVARRMESAATAVQSLVDHAPDARVTVVVEDPLNVANGFALPFLEGPVIFLWPTPPAPGPTLGTHRGWGEILAIHEYGHIAHLTIPSRNPRQRLLWRLAPTRVGPIALAAPMWVVEGYATVIEGKLTGSGRPNSAGRAAIIRQWALEGKLPAYSQLDAASSFAAGNMRYLVGSAYLEWLEARKGDSSLVHLWRRMSARINRSFGEAFTGVFGAPAADLYGRFTVEVTDRALQVERQLRAAGLREGELFQKLNWATGEPSVSPDGSMLAVVLRSSVAPPRLVVWRTAEQPDSGAARRLARARALDPLDVPAVDSFPRPKRAIATLRARSGRSHEFPRWFPDGVHLLVSRDEPSGDGTFRPDLFVWNFRTGTLRRLTRGAAIRNADPSPDGRSAAAVRCENGICGLVLVDVRTGAWRSLAPGTPDTVWHRPRWSPDGTRIAASVHIEGRWRTAVVDAGTGAWRLIEANPGDDASRYAPSWSPDGRSVIVVSERGGIPNLERLDLASGGVSTLTRVSGAVMAPDVSRPDSLVYFLALHAKGFDVRRVRLDSSRTEAVANLDAALAPLVSGRGFDAPPLRAESLPPARDYGTGPRQWRVLPGLLSGSDGPLGTVMVANLDPVGRLSVLAQGGFGRRGTWRGGALSAAVRMFPITLEPALWYTDRRPARSSVPSRIPTAQEARYAGAGVIADYARAFGAVSYGARAGLSTGVLNGHILDGANRSLGLAEVRGTMNLSSDVRTMAFGGTLSASAGSTGGERWSRALASGRAVIGLRSRTLRARGQFGLATTPASGEEGRAFEQFVAGGSEVPYFDPIYLSQFVAMPGVPLGFRRGPTLATGRLSLGGFAAEPFMEWVAAEDDVNHWNRLVGIERAFASVPMGFARLPDVRARGGISYSLDEPFRRKVRGWFSIIYSP